MLLIFARGLYALFNSWNFYIPDSMRQSLPDAPIILRVEVTGEIEHYFGVSRQRAVICDVFAGDGLEKGEEVYIFSDHWQINIDEEVHSIERGFVNIMEVGAEYLVFSEKAVESWDTDILSVKLYDDFYVAPVFCYEGHVNVVMPTVGDTTYVSYKDVMDNEFFLASEERLYEMEELKEEMLRLYSGAADVPF